jgi:hypothetical protein
LFLKGKLGIVSYLGEALNQIILTEDELDDKSLPVSNCTRLSFRQENGNIRSSNPETPASIDTTTLHLLRLVVDSLSQESYQQTEMEEKNS